MWCLLHDTIKTHSMYVCMYVCVCVCARARACVCLCVCVCVCVCRFVVFIIASTMLCPRRRKRKSKSDANTTLTSLVSEWSHFDILVSFVGGGDTISGFRSDAENRAHLYMHFGSKSFRQNNNVCVWSLLLSRYLYKLYCYNLVLIN